MNLVLIYFVSIEPHVGRPVTFTMAQNVPAFYILSGVIKTFEPHLICFCYTKCERRHDIDICGQELSAHVEHLRYSNMFSIRLY